MERVEPKTKKRTDEEEGKGEAAPLLDKASSAHSVTAVAGATPVERAAHRLLAGRSTIFFLFFLRGFASIYDLLKLHWFV
jgi:hypothetical protein